MLKLLNLAHTIFITYMLPPHPPPPAPLQNHCAGHPTPDRCMQAVQAEAEAAAGAFLLALPDQVVVGEILCRTFDGDTQDLTTWLALSSVCKCAGRLFCHGSLW